MNPNKTKMKTLALATITLLIIAFLSGCTYDEVTAFGHAVDRGLGSYYRTGYTPQPVAP